jgi:hypothetical protein
MNPLRRLLTFALALAPLLAQADACTLGAVAGRPDLACGMEQVRPPVAAAVESCPYCHHEAPQAAPEKPRPAAPTCCDLKPQATVDAAVEAPGVPAGYDHPAASPVVTAPAAPVTAGVRIDPDAGRAPPGHRAAPPLPSRAPPRG